jgi:ubiquinone/menaquinone biosynthesis C-methylase UbiE
MATLDHFGLLAPLYDRLVRTPDTRTLARLAALPAPGRLLDIGGGTGRIARPLVSLVDTLIVADGSLRMLRQARSKPGLRLAAAYAERLPFANDTFERVIIVDAFHHLKDQDGSLMELLRVCLPGGRLVVEEPDITRIGVWAIAIFERLVLMRSRFRRAETIADRLRRMGAATTIHRQGATVWVVAEPARST